MKTLLALSCILACACGGSAGPQGPQGPAGPAGPSGPAGATVVSARFCAGTSAAIIVNLLYQYQVIAYSNGEKEVMCSVTDGGRQFSGAVYCRTGSNCFAGSVCAVGYDVDTGTNPGFFEFRNDAPGERVIYHDADSAFNNVSVAFGATNCS